jgi:aerotaxis receptor
MRINLPVTDVEYPFPVGESLVSTTDTEEPHHLLQPRRSLPSAVTERDELLGQPHNLIRHPDMPAEAFRDMWDDDEGSGLPWSAHGQVNRRKNGDRYWVLRERHACHGDTAVITGYMSVRTKPASRRRWTRPAGTVCHACARKPSSAATRAPTLQRRRAGVAPMSLRRLDESLRLALGWPAHAAVRRAGWPRLRAPASSNPRSSAVMAGAAALPVSARSCCGCQSLA